MQQHNDSTQQEQRDPFELQSHDGSLGHFKLTVLVSERLVQRRSDVLIQLAGTGITTIDCALPDSIDFIVDGTTAISILDVSIFNEKVISLQ